MYGLKLMDSFKSPAKRKAVRISDRKHLLEFQKGKCTKCKKSFKQMKVRPRLHHKNLNPKDNRITNMRLVCPNCHDKIHQKEKKVRKKVTNILGLPEYKVKKVKVRKNSKKKIKKKATKKRKRTSSNSFELKMPVLKL